MPVRRRDALQPTALDGTLILFVRFGLLIMAISVLALLLRLPETATTHGEIAIGVVLSICVALQMFVAAIFFPLNR